MIAPSATFIIYIAGDIGALMEACRAECDRAGWCVTVTPTTFVYTGGQESGAAIGVINYARFPTPVEEIENRVLHFARHLLCVLYQKSCSVVGPERTHYLTREILAARS